MIQHARSFQLYCPDSVASFDLLLAKLQALADLPDGWRFGEGVAICSKVLQTARDICERLADCPLKADAFPSADGSLSLVYYAGDRCVETFISRDGSLAVSVEEGQGFDFSEIETIPNASVEDVLDQVTLLAEKSHRWNSSDSSIRENMILGQNVFVAHASPIPATEQVYRWLISNALTNATHQYATISNCIIPG